MLKKKSIVTVKFSDIMSNQNVKLAGHIQNLVGQCPMTECFPSSGLGHAYPMEQITDFLPQSTVLRPNEFLNESFVINIRKFVCIHSRT